MDERRYFALSQVRIGMKSLEIHQTYSRKDRREELWEEAEAVELVDGEELVENTDWLTVHRIELAEVEERSSH